MNVPHKMNSFVLTRKSVNIGPSLRSLCALGLRLIGWSAQHRDRTAIRNFDVAFLQL
jgi:hypothetical protein